MIFLLENNIGQFYGLTMFRCKISGSQRGKLMISTGARWILNDGTAAFADSFVLLYLLIDWLVLRIVEIFGQPEININHHKSTSITIYIYCCGLLIIWNWKTSNCQSLDGWQFGAFFMSFAVLFLGPPGGPIFGTVFVSSFACKMCRLVTFGQGPCKGLEQQLYIYNIIYM